MQKRRRRVRMFTCPMCACPPLQTLRKLLRHIRITHSDMDSFSIQCNLQGCKRTFHCFKTYQSHIHTYHDSSSFETSSPSTRGDGEEEDLMANCGESAASLEDPNEVADDSLREIARGMIHVIY